MSKICLKCGHANEDDAKYCVGCGASLGEGVGFAAAGETEHTESPGAEKTAETPVTATENEGGGFVSENPENPENPENEAAGKAEGPGLPGDDPARQAPAEAAPEETSEENGPENGEKISAEWNGSDVKLNYGTVPPSSAGPAGGTGGMPYGAPAGPYAYGGYFSPEMQDYARRRIEEAARRRSASRKRNLFILAFVGLMLDFWIGIGAFMCLPVAIVASVETNRLYKAERKTSAQLVWAMIVGYVGAFLGLVYFFLMI